MKEANAIEEQASKRNVELAERRLEVLKTESSWAENNKETNDELAKLEADVYRAKQEYFSKTMELLEQENTARNEILAESKARAEKLKKQKQDELTILQEAEKIALDLLNEGITKQIASINISYDHQIALLKNKLKNEKDLSVNSRKAINYEIELLDKKRYADLDKLSDQAISQQIDKEEKRIQILLESTKEATSKDHELKLQLIEQNRKAELQSNSMLAEELKQSEADINAKYNYKIAEENKAFQKTLFEKQSEQLRLEWENRLLRTRDGSMQEYELKVQQAQAEYDAILNMDATTKAALYASDEAYTNALLTNKKKLDDATKASNDAEQKAVEVKLQAAQAIGHGFQQVLEAFGEENSKLAALSKMIALFNIGLATAEAIAKGVAAAQSAGPFPANIIAIATTIGAVMSNIAQATKIVKSLKDPKPGSSGGSGGIANTTSVGSSSSNSVMSSAGRSVNSRGESSVPFEGAVSTIYSMQTRQQAENRNQGLDDGFIDKLADKLAKANEKIPAPIVDVREVTDKQRRVTVAEGGMKL